MSEEPDFTETQLSSRTVFRGKLLHVVEDQARLPDGKSAVREYIRHPGAAIIIALLDDETVLLERQFRYPLARHFIELPAGKIDPGEAPLATAQRELREECGYAAREWRHLMTLHPCIGYADERMEVYLARELTHVGRALDDEEFLAVMPVKITEALGWIREGRITEAKAVAGLLWADRFLDRPWR